MSARSVLTSLVALTAIAAAAGWALAPLGRSPALDDRARASSGTSNGMGPARLARLDVGAFSAPIWLLPPPAPAPPVDPAPAKVPSPPPLPLQLLAIRASNPHTDPHTDPHANPHTNPHQTTERTAVFYDRSLDRVVTLRPGDIVHSARVSRIDHASVELVRDGSVSSYFLADAGAPRARP